MVDREPFVALMVRAASGEVKSFEYVKESCGRYYRTKVEIAP